MEFAYEEVDHGVLIVAVDGGLDSSTAGQFVDSVRKLIHGGIRNIIIDCEKLTYVSSLGIGKLLMLHAQMRKEGGDVRLAALQGVIFDLLEATHLDQIFSIYPDVNRARLSYRAKE